MPTFDRFVLQGSPFVRLAGLSGAAAVALGAYGAHCKNIPYLFNAKSFLELIKGFHFLAFPPEKQEMKRVYDTANFYHFVHTMVRKNPIDIKLSTVYSGNSELGFVTNFVY